MISEYKMKHEIKEEIMEEEEELGINVRQRARLFDLSEDGTTWCHRGVGEVSVYYAEKVNENFLLLHSELDGDLLLKSRIQQDVPFRIEQGRFIIWTENNQGLGLSFQEKDGCSDVWKMICQVQGKDPLIETAQHDVIKQENIKEEIVDEVDIKQEAMEEDYVEGEYIKNKDYVKEDCIKNEDFVQEDNIKNEDYTQEDNIKGEDYVQEDNIKVEDYVQDEYMKEEDNTTDTDLDVETDPAEPDERTREALFAEMLDIEYAVFSKCDRDILEQLIELVNQLVAPAPEDIIPTPEESRLLDLFYMYS